MILPPYPPRRAHLRSFALVIGGAAGLVAAALTSAYLGGVAGTAAGALVMLLIATPGWIQPELVRHAYRFWYLSSHRVARFARRALLWICYHSVFDLAGRAGNRLGIEPTGKASAWTERTTLPPPLFRSQDGSVVVDAGAHGWVRPLSGWALRSGRPWVLALVPFLVLLNALDDHRQDALPADIYTLY